MQPLRGRGNLISHKIGFPDGCPLLLRQGKIAKPQPGHALLQHTIFYFLRRGQTIHALPSGITCCQPAYPGSARMLLAQPEAIKNHLLCQGFSHLFIGDTRLILITGLPSCQSLRGIPFHKSKEVPVCQSLCSFFLSMCGRPSAAKKRMRHAAVIPRKAPRLSIPTSISLALLPSENI